MISRMTKYSFILLAGEGEVFLGKLQELGLMDITRSEKPVDDCSAAMLDEISKLKSTISEMGKLDFSRDADSEAIQKAAAAVHPEGDVQQLADKALADLKGYEEAIKEARREADARRPWGDFEAGLINHIENQGYRIHFHITDRKSFREEWKEKYAISVIKEEGTKIYFVTVTTPENDELPMDEVPRPAGNYKTAEMEAEIIRKNIIREKGLLMALQERIPELEADSRSKLGQLDLYLAGASAMKAAEDKIELLTGYAPEDDEQTITEYLDGTGVFYIKEAASVEDNPPIKLKNNPFTRMFEVLTDMYGRPGYNEFDPTGFIAVFFLLFFAFCMGDAGYGLILILAGFVLKKVKSFASFAPLVTVLGIGTFVIGFIFHNFFSMDIAAWNCIPAGLKKIMLPSKIAGYDGTMVLALAVGVLHLCIAMVVKTIYATKNKGFLNSLSIWGWTLLIVGGVATGAFALAGVLDAAVTKWIIIVLGAVSAVGIFLLNDLHRNPLINIGSGLWETYNTVSGLVGDVLSYLRLYALGLAGSMLGFAFNDLGRMVLGDGGFNWVFFILIVIVGHTLNLAMAVLGAFVHPLRLNFLEFFKNSGYEGQGRRFTPLQKSNNNQ